MFSKLARLIFEFGGSEFLLSRIKDIKFTPSSSPTEVTGFFDDLTDQQVIATVGGAVTWKGEMVIPIMTSRLIDALVFKIIDGYTESTSFISYKLTAVSTLVDAVVTLPVGAIVKSVSISDLGQEKKLTLTTDYTVASNVVTILKTGGGGGKSVAVFYQMPATNIKKFGFGSAATKMPSKLKIQWVSQPYGAIYPQLWTCENAVITTPPAIIQGSVEDTTLEFTPTAESGTPFHYVWLTPELATAMSMVV